MADSTTALRHDGQEQTDLEIEIAFSNITIAPNYPLLKKLTLPNMPTRYETVGVLDGEIRRIENETSQQFEYHFCLRNLDHWQWNDEILAETLKCVFYTTSKGFAAVLPMETNIWVCGHFSSSGSFVVDREIRMATDNDIAAPMHYGIP